MQQLLDDPVHAVLDLGALLIIEVRQPRVQPAELGRHHVGGHGPQRDDGRGDLSGPSKSDEAGDLTADQGAGVLDLSGAGRIQLSVDQPIEVDQRDAEVGHLRCHISGQRQVDDAEHRRTGQIGRFDGEGAGAGAGDQDVGLGQCSRQVVQRDRAAADGLGEPLGPGQGAVGAADLCPGRRGGPGGQARHGSGADDQHPAAGQITTLGGQQLVGRADQGASGGSDPGLGLHPLTHPDRLLEQGIEHRADGAVGLAEAQRVLDLTEDLVLPHHHRVEAAGHGERVGDRTFVEVDRRTSLALR